MKKLFFILLLTASILVFQSTNAYASHGTSQVIMSAGIHHNNGNTDWQVAYRLSWVTAGERQWSGVWKAWTNQVRNCSYPSADWCNRLVSGPDNVRHVFNNCSNCHPSYRMQWGTTCIDPKEDPVYETQIGGNYVVLFRADVTSGRSGANNSGARISYAYGDTISGRTDACPFPCGEPSCSGRCGTIRNNCGYGISNSRTCGGCGSNFCGSGGNRCDRMNPTCNSNGFCVNVVSANNTTACRGANNCCFNDSDCGSNQYCHATSGADECRNQLRISGNVYVDLNRNGNWDGEPQDRGFSGKTVERRNASATSWQQSDTTSGTGGYNFPDLRNPSTHDVRIINSQYDTTCQYTLQSSSPRNNVDATNNNVDFRFTTQQYVISGNVWRDVNNNRVIDSADVRVTNTNIRIRTRDSSGNPTGLNDYINTNGVYRIDGHEHGLTYSAQLLTGTLPNGWSVVGSSTINNITINCADNTGNNFLLTNFTPPPAQPDLTIDSFTVPSGATGTSANAQVTIINDSATGTGAGFNVRFRNGAGATVNVPTGALGANASRTLTIPFTRPATANTYTADVFVDSGNAITEAVETNNTATANYSAGGSSASPNLIVSSFTVPNGPGSTSVNSSVTVANIGGASTGVGFSISVDDGDGNGTPVRVSTSALAAGSSRTITIPITTPVIGGTYIAEATADSTNVIPESNETDNTANDSYNVAAGPPPPPTYTITGGVYIDLEPNSRLNGTESYQGAQLQLTGTVPPPPLLGLTWPININSNAGTGFTINNLNAGQYTISYPVANIPAGYVATNPSAVVPPPRYVLNLGPTCTPVGPAGNQTICTAGNQSRVNFGINLPPVDPWYQGIGGDMRSDAGLINEVPSGLKFSEVDSNNTSPGVIFGFNLGGNTSEQRVKANSKRWLITGDRFNPSVIKTSYEYIDSIIQKSGTSIRTIFGDSPSACTGSTPNCILRSNISTGIYRHNGSVTINGGAYTVPDNTDIILLINGNLNINTNIQVPNTSTAIFIVNGNITVEPGVTDIHGIYSADGNFTVESNSPAPDQTLEVQGSIISNARKNTPASRFINERDLEVSNFNTPAVQIIFRPDFVLNVPDILRSTTYKVREVAPGQ